MRLGHVALTCSSHENAGGFYEGILGLRKIKTFLLTKDLAQRIFDVSCESQVIVYGNEDLAVEVFVAEQTPETKPPFVHLCLEVEDRQAFVENCLAMGVAVSHVPKGEALLTFVRDYDGNLFEIKARTG
jgi:catechol 2,3-dioxygenase-like lactoylglutathione lyase family enzyme